MFEKVLVVSAHPDDDIFGGGALFAKLAESIEVYTVYLSNGVGSRVSSCDDDKINRLYAMEQANRIIGFKSWKVGPFEDQRFDTHAILDIQKWIEDRIEEIEPDTVFTHSLSDLNKDHRITFEAAMVACRSIAQILCFEIPGPTIAPFRPNVYHWGRMDVKLEALRKYETELKPFPHLRSTGMIEHHLAVRGGECGYPMAEAFEIVRMIL